MTMLESLWPHLVDGAGAVAKEFVISQVRRKLYEDATTVVSRPVTSSAAAATGDDHGCPYCASLKHLAVVRVYMERAPKAPREFLAIYQQLSSKEIRAAQYILDRIDNPDPLTLRLILAVSRLDATVSSLNSTWGADRAALEAKDAIDLAMDLAERYNSPGPASAVNEEITRRLEQLARLSGQPVIEGEVVHP